MKPSGSTSCGWSRSNDSSTRGLGLGEHSALVGGLEREVIEHPLRERFWRQLMLALYRSGRQADALRRAGELRRVLRDEVGLDPSGETTDARAAHHRQRPDAHDAGDATGPAWDAAAQRDLAEATRFVGRDHDLADLSDLLAAHRVVTLTGPGGVGKTRLALQLAADETAHGRTVSVVELAHARDEASAVQAVAAALDVQQRQHRSLESTLIEHLHERRMLLVLDNCEHLLDWAGPFVDRVRTSCPDVAVLATSREPLGLPGSASGPSARSRCRAATTTPSTPFARPAA